MLASTQPWPNRTVAGRLPTSGTMAGAGPPTLELTAEMAAHIRATRGPGPNVATAHQHLTRLRAERNSDTTEYEDLTHVTREELFDWRLWLACRPDWEMVVGNGAWAFWFVRICSRDAKPLGLRRRVPRAAHQHGLAGHAPAPAAGQAAHNREP